MTPFLISTMNLKGLKVHFHCIFNEFHFGLNEFRFDFDKMKFHLELSKMKFRVWLPNKWDCLEDFEIHMCTSESHQGGNELKSCRMKCCPCKMSFITCCPKF